MSKILGSWSGMRKHLENEMLAIMDRRVGKRTLTRIQKDGEVHPQWLSVFYNLRFEAEKI